MRANGFFNLVGVFSRDLARRRSLWLLVALAVGALAVNHWVSAGTQTSPTGEAGPALARIAAIYRLQGAAILINHWAIPAVIVFSALLAPESRRNGTTAFLLCLGVGRLPLAAAQYGALAIFMTTSALIIHAGYCISAWPLGEMTAGAALWSWVGLAAPFLGMGAVAFALSLSFGAVETCLILIGAPLSTFVAAELLRQSGSGPEPLIAALDAARLLFPDPGRMIAWPLPGPGAEMSEAWASAHSLCTMALWQAIGVWLYARRDFGSRTA